MAGDYTVQAITIWNSREVIPTARLFPIANGLLYLPRGQARGHGGPAFLFAHRWAGYHSDPLPRALGPALAAQGYGFLSFALRRRGLEGQAVASPEDDSADLGLALDHMATLGFTDVFLVGEEVGALSVARFAARRPDLRVKGVALVRPAHDLGAWLSEALGAARYQEHLEAAARALRYGAGLHEYIDLEPTGPDGVTMKIFQPSSLFLSWWGKAADTKISRAVETIMAPVLIAGDDAAWAETLARKATLSRDVCSVQADTATDIGEALAQWARGLVPPPAGPPPETEVVTVEAKDGRTLVGLLWTPEESRATDSAVIYVHGIGSIPFRNVAAMLAPVYAEHGLATLSVGLRRSGAEGRMTAPPRMDAEDIDAWVELLASRGYQRIVTSGHSNGSISVTLHQALFHNPLVVANVHMAPTAEHADWMRRGLGDEKYAATVKRARELVAAGRGDQVIAEWSERPHPDPYNALMQIVMRADCWLEMWAPETIAAHSKRIAEVDVPIMMLSGSEDNFNDRARMHELEAAAARSPAVAQRWYEHCNHAFDGFERRVATDVVEWLAAQGSITITPPGEGA